MLQPMMVITPDVTQNAANNEHKSGEKRMETLQMETGSSVKYKLPTNTASNLKLGHIKFASSYFKVEVNIGVTSENKNEYTVSDPDVSAAAQVNAHRNY